MTVRMWKSAICIVVPILIWFSPVPPGLSTPAWNLFGVYIGTILGLMLRPVPEPVVLIASLAVAGLIFKNGSVVLAGYANSTTWLVFSAFMVGTAFTETGLGKRIAFLLIRKFGKTTLGIGYVAAVTDL